MKSILFSVLLIIIMPIHASAQETSINANDVRLSGLKNFRVDSASMVSAGLPDESHFSALKSMGVTQVIDLIPGDRSEEMTFLASIDLPYSNIAVEWDEPTLKNFTDYVATMQAHEDERSTIKGITLTHCKLNWRGAVFSYLYRVTQLGHDEKEAKQHMLATWEPNKTWRAFIDEVKAQYAE